VATTARALARGVSVQADSDHIERTRARGRRATQVAIQSGNDRANEGSDLRDHGTLLSADTLINTGAFAERRAPVRRHTRRCDNAGTLTHRGFRAGRQGICQRRSVTASGERVDGGGEIRRSGADPGRREPRDVGDMTAGRGQFDSAGGTEAAGSGTIDVAAPEYATRSETA